MRAIVLVALALGAAPAAAAGDALLRNGDFEKGGKGGFPGWEPAGPRASKAPAFVKGEGPHGGQGCATIEAFGGGYTSLTQVIESPPDGTTVVRLTGRVRADAPGTSACLLLLFYDPGKPDEERLHESARIATTGAWREVEIEAAVPPGAKKWMVRCGLYGAGRASFDDVTLDCSKEKLDGVDVTLAVAHGQYFVVPAGKGPEPWVQLSIPFPFEGQTPLAIRVESEPPDAVQRLEVRKERENRPLRVVLKPTGSKDRIRLRVHTVTLIRDRPLSDGADVPLTAAAQLPKEAKEQLQAAPGVDVKAKEIAEAARQLRRTDLHALMTDLAKLVQARVRFGSGAPTQGAQECFAAGKAVCTGHANLAAALCIAAGVPARILASTQAEGRTQEHYIIEVWTKKLGWSRMESTMSAFPWADSKNLILRIVYPDSHRSPIDVPLYVETGNAATGGFDPGPGDECWQSADTLGRAVLDRGEVEKLEVAARKAFEALAAKPAAGPRARLAPDGNGLSDRTRRFLEKIE
jgi:transglutaminase-like putative cysteine protease